MYLSRTFSALTVVYLSRAPRPHFLHTTYIVTIVDYVTSLSLRQKI